MHFRKKNQEFGYPSDGYLSIKLEITLHLVTSRELHTSERIHVTFLLRLHRAADSFRFLLPSCSLQYPCQEYTDMHFFLLISGYRSQTV
jgi:hypothetical protein